MNFNIKGKTLEVVKELKSTFGVESEADVIRKAIALALTVSRCSTDNVATILTKDGIQKDIVLDG